MADAQAAQRTVLITGGHGGLAQALRAEFQAAGYRVLAPGREEMDVTRPEAVSSCFAALERLDVLVCNAGLAENELALKLPPAHWQSQLEVNLRGAFLCAQAAIPLLERSGETAAPGPTDALPGGHIVTIGSFSAQVGNAGQTAYAAAKSGLVALTQSLAAELGPRGIRANCVLPGLLRTKMTANLSEAALESARSRHALGRLNDPRHAARFIVFLDSLPHTSGQVFKLDSRLSRWT